jgi:hypothetical protein
VGMILVQHQGISPGQLAKDRHYSKTPAYLLPTLSSDAAGHFGGDGGAFLYRGPRFCGFG